MDQSTRARVAAGAPLSLEASLDEENKEVLARLNQGSNSPASPASPASPNARNRTPPPYRSMLDVDAPAPRHGSIAGIGVGVTSPRDQRRPSKRLDPSNPSTWTKPHKPTPPTSPQTANESSSSIASGLPKIQIDSKMGFEQSYNFDIASIPTSGGGAPKSTQMSRPRHDSGGAMSTAWRNESGSRRNSRDSGPSQSKSPPLGYHAVATNPGLLSPPNKSSSLATSGSEGNSKLPSNKTGSFSEITDESDGTPRRVMADRETDEDALIASSDSDENSSSDEGSPEDRRGRRRELSPDENDDKNEKREGHDQNKLAPQASGVRSLLEPERSPSRPHEKSDEVHPPSSFGRSGPTAADFAGDDSEDDIQKAKSLATSISPLDDTVPDRYVRMIIRGNWSQMQEEVENQNSSPRLYLVCTDLSTEATYALEWTVGTMLRDGDTLLAINAIEDENAPKEPEGNTQVMAESAKAAQDTSDAMEELTRQTTEPSATPATDKRTKFVPAIEAPTLTGSMDMNNLSKKETERMKALDEISENFLKLVRKTPLQIRCMIEVIHCKSPKHLILNAIDELEPTLCVVGTRGRSSLKGVLLGSFSNYLVSKSSVPVMVARKRLKKPHHAKVNSSSIRLSNNLTNSIMPSKRRSLTQARID